MHKLIGFIGLALFLISPAFACDESCQRQRVAAENQVELPSYLSWQMCEDTKQTFMRSDLRSLENYRQTRLDTQYKGPMRNIKSFIEQRIEWLRECDNYMNLTQRGHIFKDEATTKNVFAAMEAVARELDRAIQGVTYLATGDEDPNAIIARRFDSLFKILHDHRDYMLLRGQFVTNN